MIGNSLLEYLGLRASIFSLRAIAPASIGYLISCAIKPTWIYKPLLIWSALEASFYLLVYLPRKSRLQAPPTHPPRKLSRAERQLIFERCLASGDFQSSSVAPYPTDWFLPKKSTPNREDMIDWLLWALFSTTRQECNMDDIQDELDSYISEIEKLLGQRLDERRSVEQQIRSMRITLDPVVTLHRPLLWYFIVALVDAYTSIVLALLGFKHFTPRDSQWSQSFPPRPILTLLSRPAPAGVAVPYWYRPHKSTVKHPIMFLHGIGIGLWPYIPLFRASLSTDEDVGMIIPELLPICMHMTPQSVPPRALMIQSLNSILEDAEKREQANSHNVETPRETTKNTGWFDVVLVGHSYGTFVAGWIIRQTVESEVLSSDSDSQSTKSALLALPPDIRLDEKIAHVVLVDPIPILLSNPAVAHNFLYREPSTVSPVLLGSSPTPGSESPSSWYSSAAAWQLWYFASRDADIARTLHRAFFWAEGGIWREDMAVFMRGRSQETAPGSATTKGRNIAVILGGLDQIVPAEAVRRYLTHEEKWEARWVGKVPVDEHDRNHGVTPAAEPGGGGNLEVLFNPKLDHAVIFDAESFTEPLVDLVRRYVRDE